MNNFIKNRVYAFSIILLSLSLILGYIEAILPLNIGYIGVKIGLSNIISIIGLKTIGFRKTLTVNILRLLILGIVFSNLIRFLISLSGFILSFLVMSFTLNYLNLRIVSSSIIGGVFHNIGQVICVSVVTYNISVIKLLPIYIFIGAISGLIIGIISYNIYEKLKKLYLNK